jgi:hypothetical protein
LFYTSRVRVLLIPVEMLRHVSHDAARGRGGMLRTRDLTARAPLPPPAQYLLTDSYAVKAGDVVLVHAAAGGLGQLLCQVCKALNAKVIGTVSTEAKIEAARAAGAEHGVCVCVCVCARAGGHAGLGWQ